MGGILIPLAGFLRRRSGGHFSVLVLPLKKRPGLAGLKVQVGQTARQASSIHFRHIVNSALKCRGRSTNCFGMSQSLPPQFQNLGYVLLTIPLSLVEISQINSESSNQVLQLLCCSSLIRGNAPTQRLKACTMQPCRGKNKSSSACSQGFRSKKSQAYASIGPL